MPDLSDYEALILAAEARGYPVHEMDLRGRFKGLCVNGMIVVDRNLTTDEKKCVLMEELQHMLLSCRDITDQSDPYNVRQENLARGRGYEILIPFSRMVEAVLDGAKTNLEIGEALSLPAWYVEEAMLYYYRKHGPEVRVNGQKLRLNEHCFHIEAFQEC